MNSKKREKILLIVVVVLLALFGGSMLIQSLGGTSGLKRNRDDLQEELAGYQKSIRDGILVEEKLKAWREMSLPSDVDVAQSQYKDWLTQIADASGFRDRDVQAGTRKSERHKSDSERILCWRMNFSVRGTASLSQLAEFLHTFYTAGHLHAITSINIKPVSESQRLDLNINIDAISMPDAVRADGLSEEKSTRLALSDTEGAGREEYREAIAGRALFSAYRPPEPPREEVVEEGPPPFDNSRFAYVTGITADGKSPPEVWIQLRTLGKKYRLREGGEFELDGYRGTISRIEPRSVQVDFGGHLCQVRLGGTFADAEWLTAE